MVRRKYTVGTTIKLEVTVKDSDGNLHDPTSVKVTVNYPDGAVKLSATSCAQVSAGVYSYDFQSATTDQEGLYKVTFTAVSSGKTAIKAVELFELRSTVDG